jgi:phosphatidylglycerophosphate synthase
LVSVVPVRTAVGVGSLFLAVLLTVLHVALGAVPAHEGPPGLGLLAWAVGLACGLIVAQAVRRGAARGGVRALGPADVVTLTRLMLACAVAALVTAGLADSGGPLLVVVLVTVAAVALVLDAVDGRVARRTRSTSAFGARFDGEADAFLILVLSVYVARSVGAWVLLIGLARYLFAAAGWALPWLKNNLPVRPWAKTVAAVQGVVLVVAAADVLPRPLTTVALAVSLALLAESFAWSVRWLWRHRPESGREDGEDREDGEAPRVERPTGDRPVVRMRAGEPDAVERAGR